eukprot:scaffold78591_cov63-Phaeocystis_antarctica.AAC.1
MERLPVPRVERSERTAVVRESQRFPRAKVLSRHLFERHRQPSRPKLDDCRITERGDSARSIRKINFEPRNPADAER